MMESEITTITIQATINVPIELVWKAWSEPEHIIKWNQASEDWHTTKASNNLVIGEKFSFRMEAKDGSMGFDFGGTYTEIVTHQKIVYILDDNRKVTIQFSSNNGHTHVIETFEAESENTIELQRIGWQAILNRFKAYTQTLQQ